MFSERVADGGFPDRCFSRCFPLFAKVDFFTFKLAALVKLHFLVTLAYHTVK